MTVSDRIAASLEAEGVEYVFGLPGEENEDLLFSLDDSEVRFIPTRHEQGAAFMADVWGRLTGEAGVCLATLGPGATNLLTGVADAQLDKSPVLALTGQGGLERLHQESHQHINVVNMFRPITKWNTAVSDPDIAGEVIRKAFKVAQAEKPGAVHVELSEDVAGQQTAASTIPPRTVRRPSPDGQSLMDALELLETAERPLIMAGNGAIRKRSARHLRQLVEEHEIPVVHTFMGKGAVSDRDEHSLFSIGLGFRDYVMEAVDQADLVVTVGYDIAEYAPEMWNPEGEHTIVHVDFEPAEVYTHYQPDVEIVADISASLTGLIHLMDERDLDFDTEWYRPIRRTLHDDITGWPIEGEEGFTTPGALNVLRDVMGDRDLLISDVGSHKMWIARNFRTCCPNGCIISNGLASMGIAVPGGIAASLVHPNRNIVCATGDGGFMMNSQELETARRLSVDMTVVIFNDNDYGLISWKQQMSRGTSTSTRIGNPDFPRYAESFGIDGYRPETADELVDQVREAVTSDGLAVVEVPIDTSVNFELLNRLEEDGVLEEGGGVRVPTIG